MSEANKRPQLETRDDLFDIIGTQNAAIEGLHKLVAAMDLKLRKYVELVDIHHEIFIRQGICKPRPTGENPGGPVH